MYEKSTKGLDTYRVEGELQVFICRDYYREPSSSRLRGRVQPSVASPAGKLVPVTMILPPSCHTQISSMDYHSLIF